MTCARRARQPAAAGAPEKLLDLLPTALFGALVVTSTFGGDPSLVLDACAVGLAAAGIALWRKTGNFVVVLAAAITTALVRAAT